MLQMQRKHVSEGHVTNLQECLKKKKYLEDAADEHVVIKRADKQRDKQRDDKQSDKQRDDKQRDKQSDKQSDKIVDVANN